MTRRYDDVVDVRRRDEVPAEFLWRGRLYVVRDVLSHWVEAGAWWTSTAASALLGTDGPAEQRPGESGTSSGGAEREVWRVEASAGRTLGTGIYDLCFDWSVGTWTLARALD